MTHFLAHLSENGGSGKFSGVVCPEKKNSDIDLFIVASAKHLWLVRLLVSLITQIKGLRHNNKIDNRLCLSFYTTDNLSLKIWVIILIHIYVIG